MKPVLLDTVGLIALWEAIDQWNPAAVASMKELQKSGAVLVTTSFILLECGNAAARKPYRSDVCSLRRNLKEKGALIIPTEDDIEKAWTEYNSTPPTAAGIVDQISFIVMRRLGITDAFTNDRHFRAAGFNTLF